MNDDDPGIERGSEASGAECLCAQHWSMPESDGVLRASEVRSFPVPSSMHSAPHASRRKESSAPC